MPSLVKSQAWHACSGKATRPLGRISTYLCSLAGAICSALVDWYVERVLFARRTSDLFKQLESRSLTEDEQTIIQQRVSFSRPTSRDWSSATALYSCTVC